MLSRSLAALAATLFVSLAHAQYPSVAGERALAPKSAPLPELRLGSEVAPATATLPPVSDEEVQAVRDRNMRGGKGATREANQARVTIGLARPLMGTILGARQMDWKQVAGGQAAQAAMTSPDAGSLRLAIDLAGVPPDVEMVFFGSADPSRLEGPVKVGDIPDRTLPWWSPLTEGQTQTVEFFVPSGHEAASLPLTVAGASHLFTTPSTHFTKRLQDIGTAGSCNVDVPCSSLAGNAAFRDTAESVAQMVFSDAGFTVLCTGTLLNDSDATTQTPWFYSANHCFENDDPPYKTAAQMQTVANTLTTLWDFEASSCNSRTPRGGWLQLGGGATHLYHNVQSDVLFLRLNASPPSFAYYSGWDASPVSTGSGLTTIHHPEGDLKKVTQGSMVRFNTTGVGGGSSSFIEVLWGLGTTEAGSSGAGLWTSTNGQYAFRGALWGGSALCTNPSGTDFFSRFDQVYPQIAQYLGATSSPAVDYTDLWWNPSESGWGLNLVQHASKAMFGVWYTYELDGSRTWYVIPGGSWVNANTFTGTLFTTSGPPFNGPFNPSEVEARGVGTVTLTFTDANHGTFAWSVDGMSGTKSITRQSF
jgi:lysyl endopeptidase